MSSAVVPMPASPRRGASHELVTRLPHHVAPWRQSAKRQSATLCRANLAKPAENERGTRDALAVCMRTLKDFADSASLAYVRHHLRLVHVAALAPVLVGMGALTGCVSDDSSSSPDDAGAPVDANYVSAQPPSPSDVPTNVTASHNFAIHHIHLGDETDPATNAPDWPRYGYDLDHKNTTPASTDVCKLATDTSLKSQSDGPGGIDNSFGENLVPLLAAVMANPSMVEDTALAAGQFTLMLDVTGSTSRTSHRRRLASPARFSAARRSIRGPTRAPRTRAPRRPPSRPPTTGRSTPRSSPAASRRIRCDRTRASLRRTSRPARSWGA